MNTEGHTPDAGDVERVRRKALEIDEMSDQEAKEKTEQSVPPPPDPRGTAPPQPAG